MFGRIEDFEVLEVIGTGSFGTCYKVRNKQNGHIYVWKAIDYGSMTEEKKQLLVSEVNLLSRLHHPHIVRYYDRILHKETTTLYIIMEWCEGGDLAGVIRHHKLQRSHVEEVFVWRVLYQTGRALQACHSHLRDVTVLHRDIKPANVFLDGHGNVKLGDFGLARVLRGPRDYSESVVGTPYYMSPEVIKGSKYDRKSDIWALGCLVYELSALSPPFAGSNIQQLASNIREGKYNPIPSNYSEDLRRIIELMLSVQHQFRPTIEVVLHHPTVVSHVSRKTSKEHNRVTGTLALANEKAKTSPTLEMDPEKVSEDIFQGKWMTRLESLRQKESSVRKREEKLAEKERSLQKREKHLFLVERLTKEKLARAEVYLRQCKALGGGKPQKYKMIEDLDTSLSADPGDTSILPTSAKIDPEIIPLPSTFTRSASERRPKQVHFNVDKTVLTLPPVQENGRAPRSILGEIRNVEPNKGTVAVLKTDNKQEREQKQLGAIPKEIASSTLKKSKNIRPNSIPGANWIEERNVWLENKRAAYHSVVDKENMEFHNYELKEVKKRLSKLSLFSK